jgi:WD40 repeat protein
LNCIFFLCVKIIQIVLFSKITNLYQGSRDNKVIVWDVETGDILSTLEGHSKAVNAIQLAPEKNLILSASNDSTIRLWDYRARGYVGIISEHYDGVKCMQYRYGTNDLISGGIDKKLKLMDLRQRQCVWNYEPSHKSWVTCAKLKDNLLVTGSLDSSIKIWEVDKR